MFPVRYGLVIYIGEQYGLISGSVNMHNNLRDMLS
jgi:hypothetical protein